MATNNPYDPTTGAKQPDGSSIPAGTAEAPTVAAPASATASTAPVAQAATAAPMTAAQAQAAKINVDPTTQTVQGQLAGILSSGNPLLVQAQTRAKQQMQQRGLLNSSMAVGAGEAALQEAALPIASADSSTYNQAATNNAQLQQQGILANQAATNQASALNMTESNATNRYNAGEAGTTNRYNAGAGTQVSLSNAAAQNAAAQQQAQLQSQTGLANLQAQTQTGLANLQAQTQTALASLDNATRLEMSNIQSNYQTLIQANQSASDLYGLTVRAISSIMQDPNLDANGKMAARQQQLDLLKNGMALFGGMNNLNLNSLLDFSDLGAAPVAPDAQPAPAPAQPVYEGGGQ